jgi:hypothetical protein
VPDGDTADPQEAVTDDFASAIYHLKSVRIVPSTVRRS